MDPHNLKTHDVEIVDKDPSESPQKPPQSHLHKSPLHHQAPHQKVYTPVYSLLGDIGGTNMRLELVLIQPPHSKPLSLLKKHTYPVKQCQSFLLTIQHFLSDISKAHYPQIAVMGVAGPVEDNSVFLSNVKKWGQLKGEELAKKLGIREFQFLNDFIAISHGLTEMEDDNFVSINGLQINKKHIRGVLGPGTGLGNSVIMSFPFRKRERIYILPSQGGHCDSPYIDQLTSEYYRFIAQKLKVKSVGLEYSFCGPAIPYMYQFFAHKNPTENPQNPHPTSQQIFSKYFQNPQSQSLEAKTISLFLDLYCTAISNYIVAHMCTGGLYLVGSLTKAVAHLLRERDIVGKFCERHPEMENLVRKVPIVVSKQVDLGLIGAYVKARRIIADEQHQ